MNHKRTTYLPSKAKFSNLEFKLSHSSPSQNRADSSPYISCRVSERARRMQNECHALMTHYWRYERHKSRCPRIKYIYLYITYKCMCDTVVWHGVQLQPRFSFMFLMRITAGPIMRCLPSGPRIPPHGCNAGNSKKKITQHPGFGYAVDTTPDSRLSLSLIHHTHGLSPDFLATVLAICDTEDMNEPFV